MIVSSARRQRIFVCRMINDIHLSIFLWIFSFGVLAFFLTSFHIRMLALIECTDNSSNTKTHINRHVQPKTCAAAAISKIYFEISLSRAQHRIQTHEENAQSIRIYIWRAPDVCFMRCSFAIIIYFFFTNKFSFISNLSSGRVCLECARKLISTEP